MLEDASQNKMQGARPNFVQGANKIKHGEKMVKGRVRIVNLEKNQAFILSEEMFMITGREVFCLLHILDQSEAGPGDHVLFFLHWNQQGYPQVKAPAMRVSAANGFALKGVYEGETAEGGLISCPDLYALFKHDTYVEPSIASTLMQGQTVAFNAYISKDGKPNCFAACAVNESWEP